MLFSTRVFSVPGLDFRRVRSSGAILGGLAAMVWLGGCATISDKPGNGKTARDETVKLQIVLDAWKFGPGVVDGHRGEFTDKALEFYREAKGLPKGYLPDTSNIEPYTTYTITAEDKAMIGTMAEKPEELAKQKRLPYVSMTELLGERFHTTPGFLAELNPGINIETLPVGSVVKVTNVHRPFRVGDYPSAYPAPPKSVALTRHVYVDTKTRMLEVRDSGKLIAAFPITPGSEEHPAPLGDWKVVKAVPWPWYRYDEGVLERGERTKVYYMLPPGPNSPVGILWTGLNRPGIGIHGTTSPDTIGRAGSHGCIRLSNWDAATFYTLVQKNVPVTIR